jgi:hypothetical protein
MLEPLTKPPMHMRSVQTTPPFMPISAEALVVEDEDDDEDEGRVAVNEPEGELAPSSPSWSDESSSPPS